MKCPRCQSEDLKVLDTRAGDNSVRRRRKCLSCAYRFTTYERIEEPALLVIKKDQTRDIFDREKIIHGIIRSAQNRPISREAIEDLVDDIEQEIKRMTEGEIQSEQIGKIVMDKLSNLDEITYIRFASVYHSFKDISEFEQLLREMAKE
ncbi:MAG: transcriptional regulator NrdR [Lactovum sp.]